MRATVLAIALVLTAAPLLAASPRQHPESGRPGKGDFMKMRGCVSGSLLTSVQKIPPLSPER